MPHICFHYLYQDKLETTQTGFYSLGYITWVRSSKYASIMRSKLYFHDGTEQSLPYTPEPRPATEAATAIFNFFNFWGWTGPRLINSACLCRPLRFDFPLAGLSLISTSVWKHTPHRLRLKERWRESMCHKMLRISLREPSAGINWFEPAVPQQWHHNNRGKWGGVTPPHKPPTSRLHVPRIFPQLGADAAPAPWAARC